MITKEMQKYNIKDIKDQHLKAKMIMCAADENEIQQIKLSISDGNYQILREYYGISCKPKTIAELAREDGVTRERIDQIVRKSEITIIRLHENFISGNKEQIDFNNLSVRSRNGLIRYMQMHYGKTPTTIKDITMLTIDELKKIRNIGPNSVKEITNAVSSHGYAFRDENIKNDIERYFKSFEFSVENSILRPLKCNGVSTIQDLRKMSRKDTERILSNPLFVEIAIYVANSQTNYEL